MPHNFIGLPYSQRSDGVTSTRTHHDTETVAGLADPLSLSRDASNLKTLRVTIVTSVFSGPDTTRLQSPYNGRLLGAYAATT
jgi:hypothetical protein